MYSLTSGINSDCYQLYLQFPGLFCKIIECQFGPSFYDPLEWIGPIPCQLSHFVTLASHFSFIFISLIGTYDIWKIPKYEPPTPSGSKDMVHFLFQSGWWGAKWAFSIFLNNFSSIDDTRLKIGTYRLLKARNPKIAPMRSENVALHSYWWFYVKKWHFSVDFFFMWPKIFWLFFFPILFYLQ